MAYQTKCYSVRIIVGRPFPGKGGARIRLVVILVCLPDVRRLTVPAGNVDAADSLRILPAALFKFANLSRRKKMQKRVCGN